MNKGVADTKAFRIEWLAVFRAHRSQYEGEWQYQIECLINGNRVVQIESAKTVREAKLNFKHRQYRRWLHTLEEPKTI